MNYQHAYHAGNFSDVVKHCVLVALLHALKQKEGPISYLETHSGAGSYDLNSAEAGKTSEAQDGIFQIWGKSGLSTTIAQYLMQIQSINDPSKGLRFYPGSPQLAAQILSDADSIDLCEIEAYPANKLKQLFAHDPRVKIFERDGYAALKALLPPKIKRGLVLIDPPFEAQEREFKAIQHTLMDGWKRWATGVYAVWYPIKLRQHINPFHRWLKTSGAKKVLVAELCLHPDNSALRLNGCGVAIINAPWQLDQALQETFSALHRQYSEHSNSRFSVEWLTSKDA